MKVVMVLLMVRRVGSKNELGSLFAQCVCVLETKMKLSQEEFVFIAFVISFLRNKISILQRWMCVKEGCSLGCILNDLVCLPL